MFVQVIRGRARDAEALRRLMDRWNEELRPGATGFLGTTAGVTATGEVVALARFVDAAAARRNSDRPEQSAWWAEAEKCFDGPVTFRDSGDVVEYLGGGSDSARFVQVMEGVCTDRPRAEALEREWVPRLSPIRPDLLGGYTAWHDDGRFTEVAYFTSEADARAGEAKPLPDEVAAALAESQACYSEIAYLDLTDPWLS
jgi:hypothetical protein